jgi:hypothetical protein
MTGAPVDRSQLGRSHETVAYLAEHSAPTVSLLRTDSAAGFQTPLNACPTPLLKDVKSQAPQAVCEVVPINVPRTFLVNPAAPPFDNRDLRRAMVEQDLPNIRNSSRHASLKSRTSRLLLPGRQRRHYAARAYQRAAAIKKHDVTAPNKTT